MGSAVGFQPDTRLIKLFVEWIKQFDSRHARNWARLYHADPEAAMCEATFWDVLTDCGVTVEPNADLDHGEPRPDFRCSKAGYLFYVEVTCIHIETASRKTSLDHQPDFKKGGQSYGKLNDAIFNECRNKTPQCSDLDAPCLLGIATFHFQASVHCIKKTFMEWLLTGEANIGWDVDVRTGEAASDLYQVTHGRAAAFIRPDKDSGSIEHARCPVSGLLVGGFGVKPPSLFGLLHPRPVRGFDHRLLDRILFCRLVADYESGLMSTEWLNESSGVDDG